MQYIWEETTTALWLTAEQMKHYYNQHQGDTQTYKPGDLVLLEGSNPITICPLKTLDHKCFWPFPIISKIGTAAYKLKLPHMENHMASLQQSPTHSIHTPTIQISTTSSSSTASPHWPRTRIQSRRNHWLKISLRKTQISCPLERLWFTWMHMGTPK